MNFKRILTSNGEIEVIVQKKTGKIIWAREGFSKYLQAPTISISGDILTIDDVDVNAETLDVYVGDSVVATITIERPYEELYVNCYFEIPNLYFDCVSDVHDAVFANSIFPIDYLVDFKVSPVINAKGLLVGMSDIVANDCEVSVHALNAKAQFTTYSDIFDFGLYLYRLDANACEVKFVTNSSSTLENLIIKARAINGEMMTGESTCELTKLFLQPIEMHFNVSKNVQSTINVDNLSFSAQTKLYRLRMLYELLGSLRDYADISVQDMGLTL